MTKIEELELAIKNAEHLRSEQMDRANEAYILERNVVEEAEDAYNKASIELYEARQALKKELAK
jgi:hypothetical protein